MKKLILILLTCAMLVGCLVSCKKGNRYGNESENPPLNDNDPIRLTDSGKDYEIVSELKSYLDNLNGITDTSSTILKRQIDKVKQGYARAFHVIYDPAKYYFVGAYFNPVDGHEETNYCCASKYTWVKFQNENELLESYENMHFVVAFQINKAFKVEQFESWSFLNPTFEHYLMYEPNFIDGVNANDAMPFNESVVYFDSTYYGEKDYILESINEKTHFLYNVPCVEIDGKYFMMQEIQIGESKKDLEIVFGQYYNDLMAIMIVDAYSESKNNVIYRYGLFDIEEFAKSVLK